MALFTQLLDLGWVLVGEVCLGKAHKPNVSSYRTTVFDCHRLSLLQPCTNFLHVREEHHGKEPGNNVSGPSRAEEDSRVKMHLTAPNKTTTWHHQLKMRSS